MTQKVASKYRYNLQTYYESAATTFFICLNIEADRFLVALVTRLIDCIRKNDFKI